MGYGARNMSDQRSAKLSHSGASTLAAAWRARLEDYLPFLKQHWRRLAGGTALVLVLLAWFDGGEEPLHPITQSVDLKPARAVNP